ncbi:hypothetical protein HOY82DRAFT_587539 [Tuber indicum]|nr:hypothetical protein HOY82DRAFT_587539 [Tuber indicum]
MQNCYITDRELNLQDEEGHGVTGLIPRVLESTGTATRATEGLLACIKKHVPEKAFEFDRTFLARRYLFVVEHLNPRIIDVSMVKEGGKVPKKRLPRKARMDILESNEELRYYKSAVFDGKKRGVGWGVFQN